MTGQYSLPQQLVFGLDIGTRNIVGTVGFLDGDTFNAVAQCSKAHETRAMIDGQIHDIIKVGATIKQVKEELEQMIDRPLTEVCIAAAGRVLRTITTTVEIEYDEETVVDQEKIYALDLMGIEKAQEELQENKDSDIHFYCVGYSVIRYYLNGYVMGNLEGHKASRVSEDIIATFLPDDVVDGLYAAVEIAGLEVANLTLEPIAAINVAIPEKFRMLNIGLIDVGAGTSDICITKDGSIVAYGMIPMAGDELTEIISKQYLVDFDMAEHIKTSVLDCYNARKERPDDPEIKIHYEDIIGIPHEVSADEVCELLEPALEKIADEVAGKMLELNGDKAVSAIFVVGGGGKIPGFTDKVASKLGLLPERVALRGEEVMGNVRFFQEDIKKDSLLVTPIGICLNYYDKKNNFIFVQFNGERMKLYNSNHLTVVEAAMQAGFPNDGLFPKRGKELNFTVNEQARMIRGQIGEAAVITLNGETVDMNTPISSNDKIIITPSTAGEEARLSVSGLPEFENTLTIFVNEKAVKCPVFVQANGELVSGYYDIKENDNITVLNYYTLSQLLEFMDIILPHGTIVNVNNKPANPEDKIYDNFNVDWIFDGQTKHEYESETLSESHELDNDYNDSTGNNAYSQGSYKNNNSYNHTASVSGDISGSTFYNSTQNTSNEKPGGKAEDTVSAEKDSNSAINMSIKVFVNEKPVILSGKPDYKFVDVFDFIDFNLSVVKGKSLVTKLNGQNTSGFMQPLKPYDKIEIYWEE